MNATKARAKVREIIAEQSCYSEDLVKDESKLMTADDAGLCLDSLDIAELSSALEHEFGIEITDAEAEQVFTPECTVENVADYVIERKELK